MLSGLMVPSVHTCGICGQVESRAAQKDLGTALLPPSLGDVKLDSTRL